MNVTLAVCDTKFKFKKKVSVKLIVFFGFFFEVFFLEVPLLDLKASNSISLISTLHAAAMF